MNEFEWLRQSRALNTPVAPTRDLWPDIHAHLRVAASAHGAGARRRRAPWAMAAAVVLISLLAGSLSLRQNMQPPTPAVAQNARSWTPHDPRLGGAAIELHAAHEELTQALRQAPESAYLRRLLQRTSNQRSRLQRLDHETG